MKDDVNSSLFARVLGALLFCALTISSVVWFLSSAASLISDISNSSSIVTFNKGAMYMFGASTGAFFLSVGVVYHSLFSRKVPEKIEKILMKGVIVGILIMFTFPQVVHFSINEIIDRRHYIDCHEAEYSWLLYKKYVYTEDEHTCKQLVKEITKSSSGR